MCIPLSGSLRDSASEREQQAETLYELVLRVLMSSQKVIRLVLAALALANPCGTWEDSE